MSLQQAAKQLEAQGRNKDSVLVHMSPREVNSLQELAMAHGGSLSINPNTGLPEAGFLDSIMPMVVGAGLAAATGGTSLAMSPGMIGLGVGGFEALRTGDLGKGLMAGLGAYGGAGMMGGFMGAGAEAAANAKVPAPTSITSPEQAQAYANDFMAAKNSAMANSNPFTLASDGGKSLFNNGFGEGLTKLGSNMESGFGGAGMKLGTTMAAAAAPAILGAGEYTPPPMATSTENPTYKYHPGTTTPMPQPDVPRYTDSTKPRGSQSGMSENFGRERKYYSPSYEFTGMQTIPKDQVQQEEEDDGFFGIRFAEGGSYVYDPKTQTYKTFAVETPTITGQSKEKLMAEMGAGEGSASGPNGTPQGNAAPAGYTSPFGQAVATLGYGLVPGAMMADQVLNGGQLGQSIAAGNTMGTGFFDAGLNAGFADSQTGAETSASGMDTEGGVAEGIYAHGGEIRGISHLGSYSDGGRLLRGPGDGVSDDIPAVIGKKQPARLADGEFVVPARIVSELGNGSTEAGARKLYAMMDRIQAGRKKTMGDKKQFAKDSKADRHLPA